MTKNGRLLKYMQAAAQRLLDQEGFDNGWKFKTTQAEAIQAYSNFLSDNRIPAQERLEGFFDIATGVGKTAIFVAIVNTANQIAQENKDKLRCVIVVPTKVLLRQTAASFNTFAKGTDEHIGFYGDGHANLKQPITLMTYNAWTKLSKEEKISADNVDILISDEAHRGTSEERVYISELFNGAVRLAFTASSEFDQDKAVYNSHKHEIYHKPIAEAVMDKELAAYIQTQFHIVRAEPSKNLKDKFDGEIKGDVKRKLRQQAWTKWAVRYYREGRDDITGDPVSDNQAGFFVDDTSHANALEKALNGDGKLAKLAKSRNCKAVAVAVHSKLSKKENERRLDDYMAGKYMAVIGDEMLKEGFDYEPMKTVVDWPHGSLVDKVQILGRGARKWFNTAKDRFEGLVFADTVVYVGSDDAELDKLERARALRNAILASDVLNDIRIYSDDDYRERGLGGGGGGYPTLFGDDPDVEEYTTLEEIKTLLAERSKLKREHVIPISRKMRKTLNDHISRTGVGSEVLLAGIENVPESLTPGKIYSWRKEVNTVDPDEWNLIINAYEALPDRKMVQITKAMRATLNAHVERTQIGGKAFCKLEGVPEGFTPNTHYLWCSTQKKAPEDQWKIVIGMYETLKTSKKPKSNLTTPITKKMRDNLRAELERTQFPYAYLAKAEGRPKTLTAGKIKGWLNNRTEKCDIEEFNWVLSYCKILPAVVVIDDKKKVALRGTADEKEARRISSFLSEHPDKPKDLDRKVIGLAINAGLRNFKVLKSHYDWMVKTLKSLPTIESESKISNADRKKIESELQRTKAMTIAICKDGLPDGLKQWEVDSVIKGNKNELSKGHLNWLLQRLASLPSVYDLKKEKDKRKEFDDEMKRTKIKGAGLGSIIVREGYNLPDGLTVHMIKLVLEGKTQIVQKDHHAFMLSVFSDLPTKIELKDSHRALLKRHKQRTGISYEKAIKFGRMAGLKVATVNNWDSGASTVAEKGLWESLIATYASLPNKGAKPSPNPEP